MRKRVVGQHNASSVERMSTPALRIAEIAAVEVSSETQEAPIEDVFLDNGRNGWRAAEAGEQRIRIVFDKPQQVRKLRLKFVEIERARTHEFSLNWFPEPDAPGLPIVRQQWTFSPSGGTTEMEEYRVHLDHVCGLELIIKPDLGDPTAVASLAEWQVYGASPDDL